MQAAENHRHSSSRRSLSNFLRTGTPYRTPDRRRFGPLGSSRRTPGSVTGRQFCQQSYIDTPVTRTGRRQRGKTLTPATPSLVIERTAEEINNIKALNNKTWHIFRLTPLYNYKTMKSDFQLYSRSLSSHIEAETKKGLFVDTSEPGNAVVGHFSGLDIGEDDPKSLLVQVKGKARKGNEERVIGEAILFSTDLEENPLRPSLQKDFTYFSTMLIRGSVVLSQTIQNWVEVQFDCRVIPQTLSSQELVFMAAMFTGFGEDHKPVELVYQVPEEVEGLSDITYTTVMEDCLRLWNCVRSSDTESFTSKEANLFISGLESHFYECFAVKLHAMPLLTVGTPVAFIGRDGKIKFLTKSVDNAVKVCRHLTDLALDQLKAC